MYKLTMMRSLQAGAGIALLAVLTAAQAQWIWVDGNGRKQVSDRPPPAAVARKDILRAPANAGLDEKSPAPEAGNPAANPPVVNMPEPSAKAPTRGLSLAEREADYRKRQQEKAEADKKAAEQAQEAARKNVNCNNARTNKAAMDAGLKIKSGPGRAEFMNDEERARESAKTDRFLNEHCR